MIRQKAVAPVEFPPALRAKLARPSWSLADRFRREAIFDSYRPKIAIALAQDHIAMAGDTRTHYYVPDNCAAGHRVTDTWRKAEAHTLGQHRELQRAHLGRAFDEQEIRDYAENYSRMCAAIVERGKLTDFVRSTGAVFPDGRTVTEEGARARTSDAQWWRRQLRRTWTRRAENVMREIGIVRKGREPYASDDAVMARAQMKAKGRKFLENHEAVNEKGEQLSLFNLAEHSLANPALRRGEFMCRVRGFEEIATDAGHVAQFWTLTAPSAFHAQISEGRKNPNFTRQCVRDAQAWLCKQWARARARLKRLSILFYGFRIAEPHHDGTPHWHLLLFVRARDAATLELVVREYWLRNDKKYANEKGAHEYRAKCIEIDSSKGSAVGYVAKYVSKNIDGAGAIGEAADDETGARVVDSCRRIDAWASLHGVRQFQQVGGPPVGLWRELRRLTVPAKDSDIERTRARADVGDWCGFIRALSFEGIAAGRRVGLRFERQATGELTKYAEEKAAPVVGVCYASAVEITRPHMWRIQRCGTAAPIADSPMTTATDTHAGRWSGLTGLRLNPSQWSKQRGRRAARIAESPCIRTAAVHNSESESDLGPVAITVRGPAPAAARSVTTAPAKAGASTATAAPVPFFEWESTLRRFEREHGRYPSADETKILYRGTQ